LVKTVILFARDEKAFRLCSGRGQMRIIDSRRGDNRLRRQGNGKGKEEGRQQRISRGQHRRPGAEGDAPIEPMRRSSQSVKGGTIFVKGRTAKLKACTETVRWSISLQCRNENGGQDASNISLSSEVFSLCRGNAP